MKGGSWGRRETKAVFDFTVEKGNEKNAASQKIIAVLQIIFESIAISHSLGIFDLKSQSWQFIRIIQRKDNINGFALLSYKLVS